MSQLILVRHGESLWNRDNRFTGWADVGLTAEGRVHMQVAGRLLRQAGIGIDLGLTSVLSRCILSHAALLEGMGNIWVPTASDWRLNERHYGALTGLSKDAAVDLFGADAVQRWRRSFEIPPPTGGGDGDGYAIIDDRYGGIPPDQIPRGESLLQVVARVRQVWERCIAPALRTNRRVIVTAHGNSIRALMKMIEHIADDEIAFLEVPNAIPLVYELDKALQVVKKSSFGNPVTPRSEIL
jgi:2,3-bisphosphoglycerate-dependent phosphoglycerate mutase